MIKVGITGGIGSGKSLVCKVFQELGVPIYIADDRAKLLMNNDINIKQALVSKFGTAIYNNNQLNRSLLAGIIFEDNNALNFVNSIVHPAVARNFVEWSNNQKDCTYVIEEAALLFETGTSKLMDKMITVYAPELLRIQRVMNRDKVSMDQVKQRIQHQMSDEEKVRCSDFVIYNDDKRSVLEQVLNIHNIILSSNN